MLRGGASAPERVLKWQFSGLFRNRHTWQFRGSYTKDIVISARFSFSPHETRGYSRPDTCLTCEIIQVTFARGGPCCSQRCSNKMAAWQDNRGRQGMGFFIFRANSSRPIVFKATSMVRSKVWDSSLSERIHRGPSRLRLPI